MKVLFKTIKTALRALFVFSMVFKRLHYLYVVLYHSILKIGFGIYCLEV